MCKKVIISACLLGHLCRYDGKTKKTTEIVEAFKDFEIIPFCPEAPIFGTPRERISVINIDGKNRIITDETNKDVTKLLEDEIYSFIKKYPNTDLIVLKARSPSCGFKTTPILNENREKLYDGDGIAAEIFIKKYPDIEIKSELNLF
ncbi:hypothetical protein M947_06225 [Sulfurimonas hongkongensis]|uniref:Uncharacterized protein n=1 Tax=Sulfurimonas hongkongensis TaxID=1172190 RepID=T0JN69_9BACT|nr:DUF523 domain-containing protein [Sulfurimonas hongkongensis]EQB39586.1 hypothetical protein M947_06225 [Sulfurimonas hongkongensis]